MNSRKNIDNLIDKITEERNKYIDKRGGIYDKLRFCEDEKKRAFLRKRFQELDEVIQDLVQEEDELLTVKNTLYPTSKSVDGTLIVHHNPEDENLE